MSSTIHEVDAHVCISYSGLKSLVNGGVGREVSPSTLSRWMAVLGFPEYDPKEPRQYTAQDAYYLALYGKCLAEASRKGQRGLRQRALALFEQYTGD